MMETVNMVYLLLGSNLDDRQAALEKARHELSRRIGRISRVSAVYESEPWGFNSERRFLNQAVAVNTSLGPSDLLMELLSIERSLGRVRNGNGYESRTIDIDILFYNEQVIDKEDLVVPHPRVHERMFALVPMCELAPDLVHPAFSKTILELKRECTDTVKVNVYQGNL